MRPMYTDQDLKPLRGQRKPPWLRVPWPGTGDFPEVHRLTRELSLVTVCEEAKCPNIGECWGHGTVTFMILGDTCTRACKFCNVKTGNPGGRVDPTEPLRVAEAVARLRLNYVVLTSVDRDDLPDGGASVFAETIRRIRQRSPATLVEGLIPDFQGDLEALQVVVDAAPDVLGNNIETVRRLTPQVRDPRASYDQTLLVLENIKRLNPRIVVKTGMMVGLGETEEEVLETMDDLRAVGVEVLTLGQYLQPSPRHYPVKEWVTPEKFKFYEQEGLKRGFLYVASGPLVRSSYHAWEAFLEARQRAAQE